MALTMREKALKGVQYWGYRYGVAPWGRLYTFDLSRWALPTFPVVALNDHTACLVLRDEKPFISFGDMAPSNVILTEPQFHQASARYFCDRCEAFTHWLPRIEGSAPWPHCCVKCQAGGRACLGKARKNV